MAESLVLAFVGGPGEMVAKRIPRPDTRANTIYNAWIRLYGESYRVRVHVMTAAHNHANKRTIIRLIEAGNDAVCMWCGQRVEYWTAAELNWMRKYYSPNTLRNIGMVAICTKHRRETLGNCGDEATQRNSADDSACDVDYFCAYDR